MPSLNAIPNNLVFGFGRVSPDKSSLKSFFCLTVNEGPEMFTVAPMYNLSLAGTCLADPQPVHIKELISTNNKKIFIGFIGWLYFDS